MHTDDRMIKAVVFKMNLFMIFNENSLKMAPKMTLSGM